MHLGMPECHKPFLGHCDLDLGPSFKNYCVQSISTILFDVGIPNWVGDSSWDGGVMHTILSHFDLDIDFLPHF